MITLSTAKKYLFFCSISIIHIMFISITMSNAILLYSSTKSTFINFFLRLFWYSQKDIQKNHKSTLLILYFFTLLVDPNELFAIITTSLCHEGCQKEPSWKCFCITHFSNSSFNLTSCQKKLENRSYWLLISSFIIYPQSMVIRCWLLMMFCNCASI